MANPITVKITGLDELQEKLESLEKRVSAKLLKQSMKKAADILIKEMAAQAPKHTGLLSKHFNLKIKVEKEGVAAMGYVGPDAHTFYPLHGVEAPKGSEKVK